jgi:hypothetical protein
MCKDEVASGAVMLVNDAPFCRSCFDALVGLMLAERAYWNAMLPEVS